MSDTQVKPTESSWSQPQQSKDPAKEERERIAARFDSLQPNKSWSAPEIAEYIRNFIADEEPGGGS